MATIAAHYSKGRLALPTKREVTLEQSPKKVTSLIKEATFHLRLRKVTVL
jgi:hypothetical protein